MFSPQSNQSQGFFGSSNRGGMFGSSNAGGMFGSSNRGGMFGSSGYGSGSGGFSDFMNSNSLVAKISFLLLAIFVFVIVLQLSITFIVWVGTPSGSPHLIDGMVDAKQMMVIPQDPNSEGARTVIRSTNTPNGIEFTWSVWIFIDDLQYLTGQYRHIFHKGNNDFSGNTQQLGLNFPNNAPGLYISPNTNELTVIMNTFDVINQEVRIPDIPLNKWVNIMIRCKNTTLDIYVNGTITKSSKLLGVPKQNYGDVFVGANGGFSGYISNLWYYNYALGTNEIQKIIKTGPNRKMVGSNSMNSNNVNYLSLRWFFYGGQ
jgi:Concanavalin A-like lectin/glucanases superfamily